MSFLELEGVTKRYKGESAACVSDLDFSVEKGEVMVLLGESGCGKTTILKMIAGLEDQDAGHVRIDGEVMDGVVPEKRPLSMVFQKALLFGHLTVEQNVNFAPRVNRSMPRAELARKTEEMIDLVGLHGMGKKKATQLSGGQEQRVSLARALMVEPKVLLLDEPLSALDATLRANMQRYIRQLNRDTGVTMVFVTHDQSEAVAVADRIALMRSGCIVQCDEPRAFYERPANRYVAEFFGWKNFVPAKREGTRVSCALGKFELAGHVDRAAARRADGADAVREAASGAPGLSGNAAAGAVVSGGADGALESGWLAVRPEGAVNIGDGSLRAVVETAQCDGVWTAYQVRCCGESLMLRVPARYCFSCGDEFSFDIDGNMVWFVSE